MAYNGLNWQKLELPLAAGLSQKADDRARPQPFLDICRDVQFDEDGGLQPRYPFAVAAGSIFGGGTISNARRIVKCGNEQVLFTKDTVYSWNAQLSKWVSRGTHLAVAVDEQPRFVTTGDQIDGDRAELSGTVVFAWTEGTQVYAAAMDKTTSSVLVSPTAVSTAIGRPRLVALATKILLFVEASATLLTVRAIDPAAPGTAIAGAGTTVLNVDFNLYYDVVKAGTQDLVVGACRRVTTTSYTVFTVTPTLTVTTSTKARTCDGPIAVATIPDGTKTQVVRGNGTNIQGDLLTTSTLVDVFAAQAIGTTGSTINNIAAAFSSTTTCSAFWSVAEQTGFNGAFGCSTNTVTTANVVGTAATLVTGLGLASRAFAHDGNAYAWLAFGSDSGVGSTSPTSVRAQLQNTYYLYRADGLLVSKAAWEIGGGLTPSIGHLPGVGAVTATTYAWLGAFRRRITIGGADQTALDVRSLLDITASIDDNAARRAVVLGRTLYVSGGIVTQYDGRELTEVGFCVYPWAFGVTDNGAGNLSAGTYTWKATMRWTNAQGEVERSTTATGVQLALAASHSADLQPVFLFVTSKRSSVPNLEIWRQIFDAPAESPYYLVTGTNPNTTTGNNNYVPNSLTYSTHVIDNFSDATLTTKEQNPENTGDLENLAPPGASIIIATDTRLFLAGVTGDPDRVWYSKERNEGEVAAFHDTLTSDVPRNGGAITSIAFLDDVLFVFRATAIYALPGTGLDNTGGGQNFGPARTVSLDVGAVSHEAVAWTPLGLIFKSSKGWQLLRGNGAVDYIGDKVSDFDSETVYSITVVETQRQVRVLTSGRMLTWDYRANQWGEWTITDGLHACMFGGAHVYLAATGTRTQQTTYTGLTYGIDVETAWIKPADLFGAVSVRRLQLLGEYRSSHLLRLRCAYNYDGTYVDDVVWTPSPGTVAGPLQVRHGPKRPRCQAIKLRVTAVTDVSHAFLSTTSLVLTVATSSTDWDAAWQATAPGSLGGAYAMVLTFEDGAPFSIDVADHFQWDLSAGAWVSAAGTIGVRVRCRTGSSPTVAQLEAAIAAGTTLATLFLADVAPTHVVNAAAMAGQTVSSIFVGGSFGSPTGEALKLTALGLEIGTEPGLFKRLPTAQKV